MAKKLEYINATNVETLLEALYPNEDDRKAAKAYEVSMRLKRLASALANYRATVASMADSDTKNTLDKYCDEIECLVGSNYDTLFKALTKDLADKVAGNSDSE